MKHIYFIRHAAAAGQEPEAPLTEAGEAQAMQLASFLKDRGIEYIVSSPYVRAVETIRPLSGLAHIRIHTDDRLKERVLSPAPLENWMELLERTYAEEDFVLEGGESTAEAAGRGVAVLEELLTRTERTLAMVTHGVLLSLLIRHYQLDFGFEEWRRLSNPDVYLLEVSGSHAHLQRVWGTIIQL
ncbi:histidine phosphatase family protein [Paenibacillus sp. YPG26]|uniref:histidine phosphatase family protein n=1 Tax=Paenibacillus sp. YPG26 TaxID=2878915 RepID=UPI00203EF84F|nr:histidine phosphatase family protein [Paenibacillus sp. YPG26]USB33414.1 histidine phosphatase family protein [Paenibacillus sp. YPG26]